MRLNGCVALFFFAILACLSNLIEGNFAGQGKLHISRAFLSLAFFALSIELCHNKVGSFLVNSLFFSMSTTI